MISLGGGAVLDSGTQQLLGSCTVVYLECDADTVASADRPEFGPSAARR